MNANESKENGMYTDLDQEEARLLFKRTLLETRSRISVVEADAANLTIHELVQAGFRIDGDNGYRLES